MIENYVFAILVAGGAIGAMAVMGLIAIRGVRR